MSSPRRTLRRTATLALTSVFFLLGVGVAAAAVTWSPSSNYGPHLGYTYSNKAGIESGLALHGYGSVSTRTGSIIPAGYMGAQASLYKSGAICASVTMMMTGAPSFSYQREVTASALGACKGGAQKKARGSTAAYTGTGSDGYAYYYTNWSILVSW